MRVSGPIQCMVSPSANNEEAWCVVATHVLTSVGGFLGWVPFPVDPSLWHGRPPDEGNLSQSDQLLCTLVVVHHLGHSEAQPLNAIGSDASESGSSGSGGSNSFSASIASHPTGAGYLLYLSL